MDFKELFKFQEGTQETVGKGGLCVVEKILYGLFKSPFAVWRMSCKHLKEIRSQARLDIEKIDSIIPFFIFIIRYIFEFLLHALIFITVVIAPLAGLYMAISGAIDGGQYYTASKFFIDLILYFAYFYYAALVLRIIIEIIELIKKYGLILIKFILKVIKLIFLPAIVIYHFLSYLAKKCESKTAKYEKRIEDFKKEEQPIQ